MPDHSSHTDTAAVSGPDSPQWLVTLTGVRAALGGLRDDAGANEAARRIRSRMPGFELTVPAEYRGRNRVITDALDAGIEQFVVFFPDRPPLIPAHEELPAAAGCRVLYLLDDAERAVRSWIVTAYRDDPNLHWVSPYPDLERCLRAADVAGDITLDRPICVLLSAALQHTHDPHTLVSGLWNVLPAGSWVYVSQVSPPPTRAAEAGTMSVEKEFELCTQTPLVLRSASELEQLFTVPHAWDLLHFGGAETHDPADGDSQPSMVDTAVELLTLVARRPARTRHAQRHGTVASTHENSPAVTSSPDPYFLTPQGVVPDLDAELAGPTVARVNGFLLDELLKVPNEMGIFAADRTLARQIDADVPGYRWWLQAQQRFLATIIHHAARKKRITQFVILRAPLPAGTGEATPHTIALAHTESPTTVLVPREIIPGAHLTRVVEDRGETGVAVVPAAVHEVQLPLHALHQPGDWSLDLGKPVCITMIGDPSHWPGDVAELIRAYHQEIATGSVIGVGALGPAPAGTTEAEALQALASHLRETTEPELTLRTRAEVEGWFPGWDLEWPGLAPVSDWAKPSPEDIPGPELPLWCAIATKTAT